jgi:hydroxymethylpyrimidine pyrophosphatase-like HAD family hydrolase
VTQQLGPAVEAWLALGAGLSPAALRVVLADVDGVVTPGEGHPAHLRVLQRLEQINAAARRDPCVPAVALCTGRQAPYVELMAQMTAAFLPCSFEHGAGMYVPGAFRYVFHPRLGRRYTANLAALRAAIEAQPLLRRRRAFVQPGKEAMLTLFPLGGASLDSLAGAAEAAVARTRLAYNVELNATGVEVRPRGIDKGAGCRWLAGLLGLSLRQVCGVGDSDPDLSFLGLPGLGLAAAPANASPRVRAAVGVVARAADGEGLLEIVAEAERRNRRL